MKCKLKTLYFSGQAAAIQRYGDGVWGWLCDEIPCGKYFTTGDVMNAPVLEGLAPRTRHLIALAVLANVAMEHEEEAQNCPIQKIGNRWLMVPNQTGETK